jgi:hypothetical protein
MLKSGILLLDDNALLHTIAHTVVLLKHFNWELFDHHPYSPDLPLCNYHMFICFKDWAESQHYNNEELM